MLRDCKVMVTGGAGFIGSHLTDELLSRNCKVTVMDDFSAGKMENIQHLIRNPLLKVVKEDLKHSRQLDEVVGENDLIFHLAANPEVRVGETEPRVHFEENVVVTFNLLEAMRKAGTEKTLVFASTSTVYGEASRLPTPEDYGPCVPISTYGGSKLACEALITSYVHTFGLKGLILRLANVVGAKSTHGVIFDFISKIRKKPGELKILGDGMQEKSYLYITDLIAAVMHLTEHCAAESGESAIYNVGSKDRITVKEIARIVVREMGCPRMRLKLTGGVEGGRGWKGDVKSMQLSIQKILASGWNPTYTSKRAVELAAHELALELKKD